MKITIDNGTDFYVLADGTNTHVANFEINDGQDVQVEGFTRAESKDTYDRQNIETSITFEVRKTHTSITEAIKFLVMHSSDLVRSGDLIFLATNANGTTIERYLLDAVIAGYRGNFIGVTTYQFYTILGGMVTDIRS